MKILSFSVPDEINDLMRKRQKDERMTRSEYVRKCIREEAERSFARRMMMCDPLSAR